MHMANLGVSHLSFGQPHIQPRNGNGGRGIVLGQVVHIRGGRSRNGVPIPAGIESPAVQDNKDNRALIAQEICSLLLFYRTDRDRVRDEIKKRSDLSLCLSQILSLMTPF
jgi:hypothetical protein